MIFAAFLIPSILAALLFLIAASFAKKSLAGKDVHNETILGAVLSFFLALSFLFSLLVFQEF
ncbi:hypothetical protein [Domibacillus indicus]|uniref:hypothetical protein n=1 Tax=Domibacillus indicus TaxID=1437523 RepID=UPI000617D72F|nr:hypothetical protein [Domibacillus indicus]